VILSKKLSKQRLFHFISPNKAGFLPFFGILIVDIGLRVELTINKVKIKGRIKGRIRVRIRRRIRGIRLGIRPGIVAVACCTSSLGKGYSGQTSGLLSRHCIEEDRLQKKKHDYYCGKFCSRASL
jgi:hypothetical protein